MTIEGQLQRWLSDETGEQVSVRLTGRTAGGLSRENWIFDADFAGRTHRLIARRDPLGSVLDTDRRVEVAVLRALAGSDVKVPTLRWADPDGDRLGRPSLVMDVAPGTNEHFVFAPPRPDAEKRALAEGIYAELASIHQADWRSLGLGAELVDPGHKAALHALEHWERELDRIQVDPEPELRYVIAWLRERAPDNDVTTLVHGDFKPGNLLMQGDTVTAVLDWETVHLGDPHEDLGWVTNPLRSREHRVPGVWEPRDLLEHWSEVTGLPVDAETVRWWQILANLKLSVIVLTGIRAFVEGRLDRIYDSPVRLYSMLLTQIAA